MAYIGRYNSSNIVDLKSPVSVDGVSIIGSGGTISNATLDSSVTFPDGTIIQQEYVEYVTYEEFTNNTPTSISGFSKTITLKKTNSKLFIYLFLSGAGKKDSSTALSVKITESVTSLDQTVTDIIAFTNSTAYISDSAMQFYVHDHGQSAGTTLTYTPKFHSSANSSKAFINNYYSSPQTNTKSYLLLQEVS